MPSLRDTDSSSLMKKGKKRRKKTLLFLFVIYYVSQLSLVLAKAIQNITYV